MNKMVLKTKKQQLLSMLVTVLIMVSLWASFVINAAQKAHADTIGAATSVDVDFDWDEFEAMLNPAYINREIDNYLRDLGNISNTPGVRVTAYLAIEYRVTYKGTYSDDTEWLTDHFLNTKWNAGNPSDCALLGLKAFYDASYSKETLTKIRRTALDEYHFYGVDNLTYRLVFQVTGDNEGSIVFKKSTPITINGTAFSPNYVRVGNSGYGGSYFKDLSIHEATGSRVSRIDFTLTQTNQIGYVAPNAAYEHTDEINIEPLRNLSSEDDMVSFRIYPGVKYTLNTFVRQYGGIGFVDWQVDFYGHEPAAYTDIAVEGFDGTEKTWASVYIDPKEKADMISVTFFSVDDPSVSRRVDFYIGDYVPISISTNEGEKNELHLENYLTFDGKSRVYVEALPYSSSRFSHTGYMNDGVVELTMTGNTKPVKWFDEVKTSYGTERIYLFSIDPKETSKHLILKAKLRSYPDCQVECHYYLSPEWITIRYQLDPSYPISVLEYNYAAGEEFCLETGADLIEKYLKKYQRFSVDRETQVISGWDINGTVYANGATYSIVPETKSMVAKAVWMEDPIAKQPVGSKVDTAATTNVVPASLPVKLDTSELGTVGKLEFYLEKYSDSLEKWEATKLTKTKREEVFNAISNFCLVTSPDAYGFITFQGGIAPSLFAYGTYRYKIVTEDQRVFTTEPFVVDVKGILVNPENQTLSCGGTASVNFVAESTDVKNTRYEWWYYASMDNGYYAWIKVKDFADYFGATGYNTYKMTISAQRTEQDYYLMAGQVKCKLINADTDEVLLESAVATISLAGHSMNEPCETGSSLTEHTIRCRYCHGISMVMHGKHSFRWIYSTTDPTKYSRVCAECGFIDVAHNNTTLPSVSNPSPARITLNSNDGTFITRVVTGSDYSTKDLTRYTFVNPGFVQIGWAFHSDSKVPDYSMEDQAIMYGYYDLYAVWKPIKTIFVDDLIKNFEFRYGGIVEFNDASLENDEDFLIDYFAHQVEIQWIRYGADKTRAVIGTDETFCFPTEDALELYVDSYIQLRVIDGDRMFVSATFPFVAYTTYSLSGKVTDDKGVAIEDADVLILDAKSGNTITSGHTGMDGRFVISDILQGSYNVRVKANGYDAYNFALELFRDTETTVKMRGTKLPFTDVKEGTWQYNTAKYVYDRKIILGTTATTFSPNAKMTRAQFIVILWRMAGSPKVAYANPYTDVPQTHFAATAIQWAKSQGLASGYKDGSFKPNNPMTREEFCAFMQRYARYLGKDVSTHGITYTECVDGDQVNKTFATPVQWAYERGFIAATGEIMPKSSITRIQAAAVLQRFLEYYKI